MNKIQNVDYKSLDQAKNKFIEASRKTLKFASTFGFIPNDSLGGSANVFALDLKPFIKSGQDELFITLLPEGLGTADDARPDDLSHQEQLDFWRNIAFKTLSTLTNDASASGLQTILISLYLPSSRPELVFNESFMEGFLNGFVEACQHVGCVYFSGETPQLKSKIFEDKLDIAGALFALSPAGKKPIDSSKLSKGDKIVLVESSGPHENGFTVLRELAEKLPNGYRTKLNSGLEFWQAINKASRLYTPLVQAAIAADLDISAIENITGHGWQKIMRSGRPLSYVIEKLLPVPEIFQFIEKAAGYTKEEMLKIFNYGAGMAFFVKTESDALRLVKIAGELGFKADLCGYVDDCDGKNGYNREVDVRPLGVKLTSRDFALAKS